MNWDIEGQYLDPYENEFPWKYSFTKIMNGICGEFTMKPYVNLYELEEEFEEQS